MTATTGLTAGPIQWGTCADPTVTETSLECATLTLPLDYSRPSGESIDIALVRAPATSTRNGAVLFNPGGPGGSGFDPIAQSGTTIQRSLGLEHYDLIGFDPRGVDRSGGIKCVDDAFQEQHLYLDDTPDTPEEQAVLDEADTGFAKACKAHYGQTLQYYSTANTARDMDRIREGLGDTEIGFLGISYGTYLGAVYATLFPDRVRSMALDSAYEPNGDTPEQQVLTQLIGFEGAFNDWSSWCQSNPECDFRAGDVGARWDALRQRLDDHPLTSTSGRTINQSTMDVATSAALYSKSDWPVLADALTQAEAGDAEAMLSLADDYEGRKADGTFDTLFQSIGIIECASGIEQKPPADPAALLKNIQQNAPRMGRGITLKDLTDPAGRCSDLMPEQPTVKLKYSGTGPIVIVGGTNDPATPIRWAKEMTAALGDRARMVTFTGEGHGQLLVSTCVTKIEGDVLANSKLPAGGQVCEPDPIVAKPNWWGDLPQVPGSTTIDLPAVNAALGLSETLGYGETAFTDAPLLVAEAAYVTALDAAGFRDAGSQPLPIEHTKEHAWQAPNGDLLIVILMAAEAFDTDALSGAKGAVPAGKTVVLWAYLPQ